MTLGCPRCDGAALEASDGLLVCVRCGTRYPFLGGVPCLMRDPALWRATWLNRLTGFLAETDRSVGQWRAQAARPDTLPRTRARVDAVIAACEQQRVEVQRLFADVTGGDRQLLPTAIEADAGALLQLEENVFRDWAWGQAEVDATRVLVERLAGGSLGRLAIYGAGAGRLAADVHQALEPAETWALDLNPLPLLVAARLLAGETVVLPEFPVAPHSDQGVVTTHALQSNLRLRPGFALVLADAFQPPFAPASLDTVLTSWFIDANGQDFRATAAAINRVLRPGGMWLNVGPLRFKQDLVTSFTIDEVWELAGAAGFQVESRARDDVPYFDAPASGSRRIETVFSFRARKVAEAPATDQAPAQPDWIADPGRPIPISEPLVAYGRRSVFAGSVISLIDGQRSLNDLAAEMGRLWGFDAARIQDQLRAFFAALPAGTV